MPHPARDLYICRLEREEIIAITRDTLRNRASELVAAYVFGSVARGTHRAGSDVDVGILYRVEPPATLSGLGFDVAQELELVLRRPVDVVVLNHASPDLVRRVLRDGVVVLDADRPARLAFEVHSRGQYFDLAPLRERLRAARKRAV